MNTTANNTSDNAVNVDPSEIRKFADIADKWWDMDGEFKPLHAINPLRSDYVERFASIAKLKVLDVGCGGGILSEELAKRGGKVTGIDLGDAQLDAARIHAIESGLSIDYQNVPVEDLAAQQAGQYDVVTCMEMLEHVPDPGSIIHACAALVKPGGWVVFSTINRTAKAFAMAIVGAEYVLNWLPKGTHEYKKFIRPGEMAASAENAGLVIKNICGITYNPLFDSYSLNDADVDVNYLLAAQKPE